MTLEKRRFCYIDFTEEKVGPVMAKSTHAVATGADDQEDYTFVNGHYFEWIQTGQNDVIFPTQSATGWKLPCDNANGDGIEMTQGMVAGDATAMKFIAQTDAFYIKAKIEVTTLANVDAVWVGFRELGAYTDITTPALMKSVYDEKAYIGINDNAGALSSFTSFGGADVETLSTAAAAVTGTAITLEVYVSAAGVASFKINGAADTLLDAATAVTFTADDVFVPSIGLVGTGAGAPSVELVTYECGLQQ